MRLGRRAVSGSTRRVPRELGRILRDGDPAGRGDRGLDADAGEKSSLGEKLSKTQTDLRKIL